MSGLSGTHRQGWLAGLPLVVLAFAAEGAPRSSKTGVPPHNDPRLKKPPPVPPAGTAGARAKLLVEAIREGKPGLADPFFFPRDAFRKVKAIRNPDRYYRRLLKLYHGDVLDLRRRLTRPDHIEFIGFQLSRRRRWTPRGKEANALPYWDAYGSAVLVRDGSRTRELRVRVMITWDGKWYVTHLTRMK